MVATAVWGLAIQKGSSGAPPDEAAEQNMPAARGRALHSHLGDPLVTATEYYEKHYTNAQRRGLQGWGNSLVDREVERRGARFPSGRTLEIGASSGEHLAFVPTETRSRTYVSLDMRPCVTDPDLSRSITDAGVSTFVAGDASVLPFADGSFDRTVSTCVLAHVDDPEATFGELRRVTRTGGSVVIGMPCDPGLLNRFIKRLVTYRSMRRTGIANPALDYAREHRNGISNLIAIAREVFRDDETKFHYFPFGAPTWNLNMIVTVEATIRRDGRDPRS